MPSAPTVLDAGGCVVAPGLVDLHTHLRQPGREEAETIETGSRAAALGGFTAVVAMPNTEPAIDHAAVVREVQELGRGALCDVEVAGAITVGRDGERLAPMAEMAALGVRLFTDDGTGVQDARLMRRALEYAGGLGVTLAQHCEDSALAGGGHMNEGEWSSRLGIPGQPAEAEELMVMRDIALARLTGARVHFQHLSTAGSVALVRAARPAGLAVTAEATPHHFTLTDAALRRLRPGVQGQPAAAHRGRRRGGEGRPGRRCPGRHRHRPRPPRPAPQGAALRPGAARACSGWRRHWRWRSPSWTSRRGACWRCCRGSRRPSRARRAPRRPDRARPAGQPLRDRPRRRRGWSIRPASPAGPATRRTRGAARGPRPPHLLPGRARRHRRRGAAMRGRSA